MSISLRFIVAENDKNIFIDKATVPDTPITQTDEFWNYLEANKSGSVNYFITWKTLEKYEFELPDLKRQEQIAEAIWSIEKTRTSYEALMAKTEDLVKCIQRYFSYRLPEIEGIIKTRQFG